MVLLPGPRHRPIPLNSRSQRAASRERSRIISASPLKHNCLRVKQSTCAQNIARSAARAMLHGTNARRALVRG